MKKFLFLFLFILTNKLNSMDQEQIVMDLGLAPQVITFNKVGVSFESPEKRQFYLEHINVPQSFFNQELVFEEIFGYYSIKWNVNHLTSNEIEELFDNIESVQEDLLEANAATPVCWGMSAD